MTACDESEVSSPLEKTMGAHQDLERVEKALSKLPAKSRKTFLLSRIHAKTYSEISEELNISTSAVEKHMIRTLRFLRDHLDRIH
ncbi:MAG: sigma-70 family RNA polymerase sigma factor [Exilibacterium sp.]